MTDPQGDGGMAERIATHDWSATPLGPFDGWPERIKAVVELVLASPLVSSVALGDARLLIYNDAAAALYGDRHPAALGRPLAEAFPDSYPQVAALYDRVFAGESVRVEAQPLAVAAGSGAVFDAYLTPMRDAAGTVIGAHMVGLEIGDRLRADAALRESEARYRAFVNASAEVVYRMSPDWSQMRALDGRGFIADTTEPSEDWRDLYLLTEDCAHIQNAIDHAIATRGTFSLEHRVIQANGAPGWTASRAVPIIDDRGDIVEWIGTASDVTDRKRAEEALRESEGKYRTVFETMTEGFGILELVRDAAGQPIDYRYLELNAALEAQSGVHREALLGRLFSEVFPDTPEKYFRYWVSVFAQAVDTQCVQNYENYLPAIDRWLAGSVTPAGGQRVYVVYQDVTERKRAEAALRETEERLQRFGEASQDVLWIRDAETFQWEYLTPAFETIYGLTREAALRGDNMTGWLDLIVPEDRDHAARSTARVRDGEWVTFEFRIRRPSDGAVRWLRNTDFPIADAGGRVVRIGGIGHDITDRKEFEARQEVLLAELQHRVRNLLAIIRSIVRRSRGEEQTLEDYAQHLEGRIAALARTQVLLTRRVDARVDLEELIRDELIAQAADDARVAIDGPDVDLSPKAAEVLALAMHELATNSLKYGAIGHPDARLRVTWRTEDRAGTPWLTIVWSELGVPVAAGPPARLGFGTELITQRVPYELRGTGELAIKSGGIVCTIAFPLVDRASILETNGGGQDRR